MAEPDGDILATLCPENLVAAYAQGIFPMVERGRLMWFSPPRRGLLPLDERFHVPRRLGRTLRGGRFACTIDRRFGEVMRRCAERPDGEPTWISPEMLLAYGRLHELGLAHSFEAWPADAVGEGEPIGGLYGVTLGAAFFGESMFHRVTDAGKAALVHSVEHLRERRFLLYDIQWTTPNLERYGAREVPRDEYLALLADAVRRPRRF
ncbi:MAG TPA: leucyl/phenylalanyl-tRNA--protein transferase [Phycisphaerae bacterium]|nr:leucyl/phenylalanyl-tRNA--protein transferase [Phycisphaerae bacterium]